MTPQEFDYIKRAVEALESGEQTHMAEIKILRTMAQICDKSATELEKKMVDRMDDLLYNSNTN